MNLVCFTEHYLPCFLIQRRAMGSGYLWPKCNPQWQCHYHILPGGWNIPVCHCHKGLKRYFGICSLLRAFSSSLFFAHFPDFWHCNHEAELKGKLMSLPSNFLTAQKPYKVRLAALKSPQRRRWCLVWGVYSRFSCRSELIRLRTTI